MRLAHLRPEDLSVDQRSLYDTITQGPRRAAHQHLPSPVGLVDSEGRLQGPFNAMLFHPVIGNALQELSRTLRFSGTLPPRQREIAILIVAAHERSDFEWAAHAAIGAQLGLSEAEIRDIAHGGTVEFVDPAEQSVAQAARSLMAAGDLDDDEYRATEAIVGPAGMFELATLVGLYRALALQMRLFRVTAPRGPWPA